MNIANEPEERSDEELARYIARRRESAQHWQHAMACFEALHGRHGVLLNAFLSTRVPASDCDDIYQIVWLKVWDKLPDHFVDGSFRGWLYTIARRTIIDHGRLERNYEEIPGDAAAGNPPFQKLLQEEKASLLAKCLQRLEHHEREILQSLFSGQSYAEISQTRDISANSAYKTVHRAKGKLRICLQRHFQ